MTLTPLTRHRRIRHADYRDDIAFRVTDMQVGSITLENPTDGLGFDGEVRQLSIRRANLDDGQAV